MAAQVRFERRKNVIHTLPIPAVFDKEGVMKHAEQPGSKKSFPSINEAKRESIRLQREHGFGCLRVVQFFTGDTPETTAPASKAEERRLHLSKRKTTHARVEKRKAAQQP